MRSTSTFKSFVYSVRALRTNGLSDRAALDHIGTLPNSEQGEAVAESLADLGFIISCAVESFVFSRAELDALISLTHETFEFDINEAADLLLCLDQLNRDRAEDADPVDPSLLRSLAAKMAAMSKVYRLVLYRLLMRAHGEPGGATDDALESVGLLR